MALQYDIKTARWQRVRRPDPQLIRQMWYPIWDGRELTLAGRRPVSYDPASNRWRSRPDLASKAFLVVGYLAITSPPSADNTLLLQPLTR